MYVQGRGVAADKAQALQWLQKAVDQDLGIAEQNLSLLQHKQSGFTLESLAIDFQVRADVLSEKPFDLAHRLQMYHSPRLY